MHFVAGATVNSAERWTKRKYNHAIILPRSTRNTKLMVNKIKILQALGLDRFNLAAVCGRRCPASAHMRARKPPQREHELQVSLLFVLCLKQILVFSYTG